MKLGLQVHVEARRIIDLPWSGEFDPTYYDDVSEGNGLPNKPRKAFWTSSLIEGGRSEWIEWCDENSFRSEEAIKNPLLYRPVNDPRVLVLRNNEDLLRAAKDSGAEIVVLNDYLSLSKSLAGRNDVMVYLDGSPFSYAQDLQISLVKYPWALIRENYDAVHVPANFEHYSALYGWDVESTAWFRPWDFLELVGEGEGSELELSRYADRV